MDREALKAMRQTKPDVLRWDAQNDAPLTPTDRKVVALCPDLFVGAEDVATLKDIFTNVGLFETEFIGCVFTEANKIHEGGRCDFCFFVPYEDQHKFFDLDIGYLWKDVTDDSIYPMPFKMNICCASEDSDDEIESENEESESENEESEVESEEDVDDDYRPSKRAKCCVHDDDGSESGSEKSSNSGESNSGYESDSGSDRD